MPAEFPTQRLIEVRDTRRNYRVVAVIEMVSPGNKDREDYRIQFAAKCMSYLAKGLGAKSFVPLAALFITIFQCLVPMTAQLFYNWLIMGRKSIRARHDFDNSLPPPPGRRTCTTRLLAQTRLGDYESSIKGPIEGRRRRG